MKRGGRRTGSAGGRIYRNVNGQRFAKIIHPTEIVGITFRTTTREAAHIVGAKTAFSVLRIDSADFVSRWPFGTEMIRF
jgi:hypothetical protein